MSCTTPSVNRLKSPTGAASRVFLIAAALALCTASAHAQSLKAGDGRRFYPDDPVQRDADTLDTPEVVDFELYKDADFLINSFVHPGGDAGPAVNVNTLGEVPDSS